jgi:hypothetical protein
MIVNGSILIIVPMLAALAEYQVVVIKLVNLQADVIKRLETEGFLYEDSIGPFPLFGKTLDEEAVALVLEIAEHFYSSLAVSE